MKIQLTAAALAIALVGCNSPTAPAATDTPTVVIPAPGDSAVTPPPVTEPAMVIDDASITELDPAVLAEASWTAKPCALSSEQDAKDIVAARGVPFVMEGYMVDPSNVPAGEFDVVLKGAEQFRIPVKTGWQRQDVADFFKVPALVESGFLFSTTFGGVPAGRYDVDFVVEREGVNYFCESGKTLTLQ